MYKCCMAGHLKLGNANVNLATMVMCFVHNYYLLILGLFKSPEVPVVGGGFQ